MVLFGQVSEQDCPHLLFYGPSGSGKKTLILALIKQMFGAGAEKVHIFVYKFVGSPIYFIDSSMLRPCFGVDVFFLCVCVFKKFLLQVKLENKTWKIDVSPIIR
jgi:DNA polymerase III delta prime subunit